MKQNMRDDSEEKTVGASQPGPFDKVQKWAGYVGLGLLTLAFVVITWVGHESLVTLLCKGAVRTGLANSATDPLVAAVCKEIAKTLSAFLMVLLACGGFLGYLLGGKSARTAIKSTADSHSSVLNALFNSAKDEAEGIRVLLRGIREGETYLLRDASDDLKNEKYIWVFGKLTYLTSGASDDVLQHAIRDEKWGKNKDGVIFYVPKTRAGTVMEVCRRLLGMGAEIGYDVDRLAKALDQAIVTLVPDDAFPIQIVMYSDLNQERIYWNLATANALLSEKAVPIVQNNDLMTSLIADDVDTKLIAFLDDLVSVHSGNGVEAEGNAPEHALRDLVGLRVRKVRQSKLIAAFAQIAATTTYSTTFGSLLLKCKVCPRNDNCLSLDGEWRDRCVENDMLKAPDVTDPLRIYYPGDKMGLA